MQNELEKLREVLNRRHNLSAPLTAYDLIWSIDVALKEAAEEEDIDRQQYEVGDDYWDQH